MTAPANNPPVIELRNAGKQYVLLKQKPYLVWDIFHRLSNAHRHRERFWALQEISFSIQQGESVAFIGRNGAGKSTLLGMIAGAISPTTGTVKVDGRLGALLELGAGFHPDLTGRENIYLNASLLGLGRDEIEEEFRSILEFSELQDFIDVPLRNYSSGMQVRLGFSVAIHIDPDVLIMDEALAVGDQAFQDKCRKKIMGFKDAGKTLLFVSHSGAQVTDLCSRCIWLDHGRMKIDGPARDVVAAYAADSARQPQG
jgi:ABC-type polysaccharide/polyol phosphate transport system ATPase subunit